MKIVLASASEGRKLLLEKLGFKFDVIPANLDEKKFKAKNPLALVKKIAKAKALATLAKINTNNSLIIAADSMVAFGDETFGKPKTKQEARKILKMLSGQSHFFITGLCVINSRTNKVYEAVSKSKLTFGKLTKQEIEALVSDDKVTSYAGGYTIENQIIKKKVKILGSPTNVTGIPLEKLSMILKKEGLNIPKSLKL